MRGIQTFFHSHVLAAAVLALLVGSAGATTLQEVIDHNTTAIGGREAIEAVHSVAVDLHIVDPDFTADGTYYAARPGKMRIDIKADGKVVYVEAFDGERGWQWKSRARRLLNRPMGRLRCVMA